LPAEVRLKTAPHSEGVAVETGSRLEGTAKGFFKIKGPVFFSSYQPFFMHNL